MNALFSRPRFSFRIQHEETESIFYISGVMDMQGGKEIQSELEKMYTDGRDITFNLSDTRIISSGGMSLLVEIAKILKDNQISFHIDQPSEMVLRTLKVVHVDRVIDIRTK